MTREEAKEFYPILQAYAEGRVIECRTKPSALSKSWQDMNEWTEMEELEYWNNIEYRIKQQSEAKYRPFKNAEECWQEMLNHQPFGWVKVGDWYCTMREIRPTCAFCHGGGDVFHYEDMVKQITFADGTPFGIIDKE